MARNTLFEFSANMTGAQRVRSMIKTAINATGAILGDKVITKKILKMQQDRFATSGIRAQKSPDGVPWAKLSDNTKRRRNPNRSQVLTDTDKLRKAIVVARDGLKSALKAGTGHAEVAVRHVQNRQIGKDGSVNVRYTDEYGSHLQNGFVSSWGGARVPARPFLGIGKQDAKEIEGYMVVTMNKFFAAFS
ncbi:MAG: hypothetical protein DRQ47_00325 [Gammaproteobacteria bacterium]|nr:MAG: hypothetical protein DRQ47_00325 [Gammaproteobacteria bacterium]